jgi:hypothetical protein
MNGNGQWHWPTFIITNITALILTSISAFLIQPLATRYWQSPNLEILGALPIHLYEEVKRVPPSDQKSTHKMFHHRFAIIFKVKNSSSTSALIHTGFIEGCVKMDEVIAAEGSLPPEEQISLSGKPMNAIYERHGDTVQSIRVTGIFQEPSLSSLPVPAQSIEYIGILFPTSSGPYYIVPGSASRSGECSTINTTNKWATIDQLLENASLHDFPKGLRSEFNDHQLKIYLLGANSEVPTLPSQIKPLISLRWENWANLLLPQMFENPQDTFPPVKKGHS